MFCAGDEAHASPPSSAMAKPNRDELHFGSGDWLCFLQTWSIYGLNKSWKLCWTWVTELDKFSWFADKNRIRSVFSTALQPVLMPLICWWDTIEYGCQFSWPYLQVPKPQVFQAGGLGVYSKNRSQSVVDRYLIGFWFEIAGNSLLMSSRYSCRVRADKFCPLLSAMIESFSCQSAEIRGKILFVLNWLSILSFYIFSRI